MKSSHRTLGTGALLALSLAACAPDQQGGGEAPSDDAVSDNQSTAPAAASTSTEYRDGEYTATGWYGSAPSHHDVTLTIADDIITDVAITTPAENETSLGYQQRFAAALPKVIVGRDIDQLDVDRVVGSSGCSEGFMDALRKIKEQAAT